jgi:hypothetical protein
MVKTITLSPHVLRKLFLDDLNQQRVTKNGELVARRFIFNFFSLFCFKQVPAETRESNFCIYLASFFK